MLIKLYFTFVQVKKNVNWEEEETHVTAERRSDGLNLRVLIRRNLMAAVVFLSSISRARMYIGAISCGDNVFLPEMSDFVWCIRMVPFIVVVEDVYIFV